MLPFYHRVFRAILDFAHGVEGEFPGDGVEERDNLDEEIVSTESNFAMVILDGLEDRGMHVRFRTGGCGNKHFLLQYTHTVPT